MNDPVVNLIRESHNKAILERKEYQMFGDIYVYVKDPLPREVELTSVIQKIEDIIPPHLSHDVEAIYIGQFPELINREVKAVYSDGSIYITNEQSSNEDIIDDLVHEFAHSVESYMGMHIYSDGFLEKEFIEKRKKILDILARQGYNVNIVQFLDTEYTEELDYFLYKGVGYDKLNLLAIDIFPTAYSITSLREYFAVGFEEYLYGDRRNLESVSPVLYSKVQSLISSDF